MTTRLTAADSEVDSATTTTTTIKATARSDFNASLRGEIRVLSTQYANCKFKDETAVERLLQSEAHNIRKIDASELVVTAEDLHLGGNTSGIGNGNANGNDMGKGGRGSGNNAVGVGGGGNKRSGSNSADADDSGFRVPLNRVVMVHAQNLGSEERYIVVVSHQSYKQGPLRGGEPLTLHFIVGPTQDSNDGSQLDIYTEWVRELQVSRDIVSYRIVLYRIVSRELYRITRFVSRYDTNILWPVCFCFCEWWKFQHSTHLSRTHARTHPLTHLVMCASLKTFQSVRCWLVVRSLAERCCCIILHSLSTTISMHADVCCNNVVDVVTYRGIYATEMRVG